MALTFWKRIPAIAAFILLAWQMALPWTVPHFFGGDGPSHLYGATVARDIIFHHHRSVYTPVYTIQRTALPNWTGTIALGLTAAIAGADHGEALFVSLAMLIGFLGLSYLSFALAPERSPWTPLSNFLIQTWFIRVGFYSFYLGMVLLPFVIGFYIRHAAKLTRKHVALLSAGFVILFFSHLIAVAIALAAVGTIAVWRMFARPSGGEKRGNFIREGATLLIAAAPALLLGALYLYQTPAGTITPSGSLWALLRTFGQQVFLTASSDQRVLPALVLVYVIAGVLLMRKDEWRSARGGLTVSALLCLIAFLFLPAEAFGGSAVAIRFAWAVFLLGAMVPLTTQRLEIVRVAVAIVIAAMVAVNTMATQRSMQSLSHAADSFLEAARRITPGSTLIRMAYPAPRAGVLYGFDAAEQFPFRHLDSLVAVEKHAIDLTDYEALSRVFPIINKGGYTGKHFQLWSFEGAGLDAVTTLDWVERNLPHPVDYVFLFGDEDATEAKQALMPQMEEYLARHMHLEATSSDRLLRVYARN